MLLQVLHFGEHGCAGNIDDSTGDDAARFASGMRFDSGNHAVETHQACSSRMAAAIFSPIIMTGILVLARGMDGMREASPTRRPETP